MDDREAVLASYPDGDAVWEDLGRIRLWAKYQRLGNAQSGWTDLSRDECKRRAAAEYAEQLVAAGVEERVAKRQLLCLQGLMLSDWFQPDLTTDCWDQLLRLQVQMYELLHTVATERVIRTRHIWFVDELLDYFKSMCIFHTEDSAWLKDRTLPYRPGVLKRREEMLQVVPGRSSFPIRMQMAVRQFVGDVTQPKIALRLGICRWCEWRVFLAKQNRLQCYACDPTLPEKVWREQHKPELNEQARLNRQYTREQKRRREEAAKAQQLKEVHRAAEALRAE